MAKARWIALSFTISFLLFSMLILVLMRFSDRYSVARPVGTAAYGDETEPSYSPTAEDVLTVLFMGAEDRDAIPGVYIIVRFDPVSGKVPVAVIPPRTSIPNNGQNELLSEIYAYGGAVYTKNALEKALGMTIDRYARVDAAAFIAAADTVGSVVFDLLDDMVITENETTVTLSSGTQLLDGRVAASIIRGGDTDSEDRHTRAARLTSEIINQRMDIVLSTVADQVFSKIINLIDTDISYTDYHIRKEAATLMAKTPRAPAYVIELSGVTGNDDSYLLSDTFLARLAREMG